MGVQEPGGCGGHCPRRTRPFSPIPHRFRAGAAVFGAPGADAFLVMWIGGICEIVCVGRKKDTLCLKSQGFLLAGLPRIPISQMPRSQTMYCSSAFTWLSQQRRGFDTGLVGLGFAFRRGEYASIPAGKWGVERGKQAFPSATHWQRMFYNRHLRKSLSCQAKRKSLTEKAGIFICRSLKNPHFANAFISDGHVSAWYPIRIA